MKVVKNWDELLEVVEDEFMAVMKAAKTAIKEQCPIAYEFLANSENYISDLNGICFTADTWEAVKGKLSEKAVTLLEEPITTLVPNSESIVIGNYVTNVANIFDLHDMQLYNVFCMAWGEGRWIADYFYEGDYVENVALKEAVSTLPDE